MPSIKPNKRPLFVINTMSFSKDIASGTLALEPTRATIHLRDTATTSSRRANKTPSASSTRRTKTKSRKYSVGMSCSSS